MPAAPKLLVLCDVDHTLIENGGVSRETYVLAYELLTGQRPESPPVTDGRTDVAIMENLLRDNGVDSAGYPTELRWQALSTAGARNREQLAVRGHALPGAEQALKRLADDPQIVQSALTGNIETNARILHFHDLRHTGNTLAAGTGASLRDLMTRMGHTSARAALIYQHATSDRDQAIAASLDELVRRHQGKRSDEASGT